MLDQCSAAATDCHPQEVDLENHALIYGADGALYVFNHGILNHEEAALSNAALEHGDAAIEQGVYIIVNPHTGNPVSEVVYAGLDKLREVTGLTDIFGLSSASQANIELRNKVAEHNRQAEAGGATSVMIIEVDHSRGSLTSSNATQAQAKAGDIDVPLAHVHFYGAAANAQRMADHVEQVMGGAGTVWQSTHKNDFVGWLIGGNKTTGGQDAGFLRAHGRYGVGVSVEDKGNVWGAEEGSRPVQVRPRK